LIQPVGPALAPLSGSLRFWRWSDGL